MFFRQFYLKLQIFSKKLKNFLKTQGKFFVNTVKHDFNGHEVNGIHGVYGKSATAEPFI